MAYVDSSTLDLQVPPADWQTLIRRSAAMLEKKGVIAPSYVEAIFASLERNGAYMLIAPRVLLAHARPEEGALGTGISLLTTTEDVDLLGDSTKPTRLFFTLAASDSDSHLVLLTHLAETLIDEDLVGELLTSSDTARVAEILNPA